MLANKVSILAVSPDVEDQRSIETIVRHTNWTLNKAATIAEAEHVLQTAPVSVLVCDWALPDGSWRDLWEAAKTSPCAPRLILMCVHADERRWLEALNNGAFDLLRKPLKRAELLGAISLADRSWRCHTTLAPKPTLQEAQAAGVK